MDSFWRFGLHRFQEERQAGDQGLVDKTSFGDALSADGFDGDGDSVSRGSMSPDLGELWRCGCPKPLTGIARWRYVLFNLTGRGGRKHDGATASCDREPFLGKHTPEDVVCMLTTP